jgi:hypothetical protein
MCEESLRWARSHIDDCSKHTRCATRDQTLLPTRVLCISRSLEGTFEVKLRESTGLQEKYACLSHRWGGSGIGTTCQATYAQRLDGIAWSTIPKTFQNAIEFVHALGIRYLWIDSYCIIQDSAADWDAESRLMASIFENSYLTIGATVAVNNEAGCFWDKDDFHGRALSDEHALSPEFRHLSIQKVMRHWERTWTSNRESRFPLLTRAWVFQERLLAPRVLHFSHQELVWECVECGDCQCGGFDPRSNAKTTSWTRNNSWHAAVELYTSLKLTRETDRLSAFHGFAEFYARIVAANVERDCLAGLWKHSLRLDLLWRVETLANINMEARCLCRCWDTEIQASSDGHMPEEVGVEATLQRSCQYSYSAACSETCLKYRRLCRYGNELAATGLETPIEGISCIDWHQESTSILQLFSYEQKHPKVFYPEHSIFPSWSWASAHQTVKYWTDISHGKGSEEDRSTCQFQPDDEVEEDQENSPESANSADPADDRSKPKKPMTLKVSGYLMPVTLHYHHIPISGLPTANGVERIAQSHNLLKYGLQIQRGAIDLDFHPDWILSLDGQGFIPNRTRLYVFHVIGNVYLVLKEKWFFDIPCPYRVRLTLHVAEDLRKKTEAQEEQVTRKWHPTATVEEDKTSDEEDTHHTQETRDNTQRASLTSSKGVRQNGKVKRNDKVHASGSHQLTSRESSTGSEPDVENNETNYHERAGRLHLSEPPDRERHADPVPESYREARRERIGTRARGLNNRTIFGPVESSKDTKQEQISERVDWQSLSDEYVIFRRIGILRIPSRQAQSLHNELHWIDKIEIE